MIRIFAADVGSLLLRTAAQNGRRAPQGSGTIRATDFRVKPTAIDGPPQAAIGSLGAARELGRQFARPCAPAADFDENLAKTGRLGGSHRLHKRASAG